MAKLHELLAVVGDLKGKKDKITQETAVTFNKKPHLFLGEVKTLTMFDESRKQEEGTERKPLATTVKAKLEYIVDTFNLYWDAKLQKELGNQSAKADIITNEGVVIAKEVPATFLLEMENELKELRRLYDTIPTLEVGRVEWEKSEQLGKDVYKSKYPIVSNKTEKTVRHKVLVEATDKFPAQIDKWNENVPVGQYNLELLSGMLSPYEKSTILKRVDEVLIAVKKARQRANCVDLTKRTIGNKIFDYILN